MASAAVAPPDQSAEASHGVNPWLIAASVMLATFMEVLDTAIASVALPYIAGSLSASTDEATWVLTSYLVANAIVLPASNWFSLRFGRKRFLMSCVAIFTVASFACGAAPTLGIMLLARVIQGAGGGALQPLSQAILLESFPPAKRGAAMAVFAFGVVVAPVLGPTLGGWLTDTYSWRYAFYINIPIGILALFMINRFIHDPPYISKAKVAAARPLRLRRPRHLDRLPPGRPRQGPGRRLVRRHLDPLGRLLPRSPPSSTSAGTAGAAKTPSSISRSSKTATSSSAALSSSSSASASTPPSPSSRSSIRSCSATPPSPPASSSPHAASEPSAACPSSATSPTRSTRAGSSPSASSPSASPRSTSATSPSTSPPPLFSFPSSSPASASASSSSPSAPPPTAPSTTNRSATPAASSTSCATSAAPSASPSPKRSSPAAAPSTRTRSSTPSPSPASSSRTSIIATQQALTGYFGKANALHPAQATLYQQARPPGRQLGLRRRLPLALSPLLLLRRHRLALQKSKTRQSPRRRPLTHQ